MQREMPRDELGVLVDRDQPALAEGAAILALEERRRRAANELPGERPVGERRARLERARPVGAHAEGAGDEPALELLAKRIPVPRLAGEREGLRQRHQLQVAVGLPQILDVAYARRVAIVELLAEGERHFDAALGVAIPARRHSDRLG